MAKPRLEKVEALFYVLKQGAKGGCIRILIHPHTVLLSRFKAKMIFLLIFILLCYFMVERMVIRLSSIASAEPTLILRT